MLRALLLLALAGAACSACGSDSSGSEANVRSADGDSCPDVSGRWTITEHCEAAFIGQTLQVTQTDCALSIAAPFDGFSGSVTRDEEITLSGPQSCTGTATADAIVMNCTPGTCEVMLAR